MCGAADAHYPLRTPPGLRLRGDVGACANLVLHDRAAATAHRCAVLASPGWQGSPKRRRLLLQGKHQQVEPVLLDNAVQVHGNHPHTCTCSPPHRTAATDNRPRARKTGSAPCAASSSPAPVAQLMGILIASTWNAPGRSRAAPAAWPAFSPPSPCPPVIGPCPQQCLSTTLKPRLQTGSPLCGSVRTEHGGLCLRFGPE